MVIIKEFNFKDKILDYFVLLRVNAKSHENAHIVEDWFEIR